MMKANDNHTAFALKVVLLLLSLVRELESKYASHRSSKKS